MQSAFTIENKTNPRTDNQLPVVCKVHFMTGYQVYLKTTNIYIFYNLHNVSNKSLK